MLEIADIIRAHGKEFLDRYKNVILPSQLKAIADIMQCRTSQLGYNMYSCPKCGKEHFVFHSCRNRHCSKCHANDTEHWLEAQREKLLPVPYFHMVFTLPKLLRGYFYNHQKNLYSIFMKSAAYALNKLSEDPKYLGAKPGFIMVLHTWTRELDYHPHLHVMVPAGGINKNGQWVESNPDFFVPVKALAQIFKARFLKLAREVLRPIKLPQKLWHESWNVYNKKAVQGAEKVLNYLSRYVYRIAISNSRLKSLENGIVTFYTRKGQTCSLDAIEFIWRFVKHTLPPKFHKVRKYGFYHHTHIRQFKLTKAFLIIQNQQEPLESKLTDNDKSDFKVFNCPKCKVKMVIKKVVFASEIQKVPP